MKVLFKNSSFFIVAIIIIYTVNLYLEFLGKEYLLTLHSLEQIEEISDGYVYFGRHTCENCMDFEPLLESVAKEENVQVYYFNLINFRAQAGITEEQIQKVLDKYNVTSIPCLLKISNTIISAFDVDSMNSSVGLKENIRKFIKSGKSQPYYVPQYSVTLVLFFISIIMSSTLLTFNKLLTYYNAKLVILSLNFAILVLSLLAYISTLKSLDLSFVDLRIHICNYIIFATNVFIICRIFFPNIISHPQVAKLK